MTDAPHVNIAEKLRESASRYPFQRAVVFPAGRDPAGRPTWSQWTFAQLERETDLLAYGLRKLGVQRGMRLALMVRPSLEFIALTFALFKTGAVVVLIDPGMGSQQLVGCLESVEPEGFIAIPLVQAIRRFLRRRFPHAKLNVTVGRNWWWRGPTYADLVQNAANETAPFPIADTQATDPAAIIFTSGSTGPPKGVLYEHGMFAAQVEMLQSHFGIQPGEVDLPGFPLFALFNSAMGVTTVIPEMDPTRPAQVDPRKIEEAIDAHAVTQAFGSPAIWNRVGRYCEPLGRTFPTLGRVMSAGAPVPVPVIERMLKTLTRPEADVFTPYGATEALPVALISGREVLAETAAETRRGAGTCVGRPFPGAQIKIIAITDGPIASMTDARELPAREIGEIIVQGAMATREYFRKPEATARAKIPDGERFWHRMGDVGYLDEQGRLWFCGRQAHIVETPAGRMFSECCEPIFNAHPRVYRTALVGVGAAPSQQPVIVVEPEATSYPQNSRDEEFFRRELRDLALGSTLTRDIETFLFHPSLPVDVRHNIKISREQLAVWATERLHRG